MSKEGIWATSEQLEEHARNFGQPPNKTESCVAPAVRALEAMAPAAHCLFQARNSGLHVSVPDDVASAYIRKHGEKGRQFIGALRGDATP